MKKISSKSTYFTKKIFPILLLAFFVVFMYPIIIQIFTGNIPLDKAVLVAVFVFFFLVILIFLYMYLLYSLLDEVHYDNKSLLVKKGRTELVIPFYEIKDIAYSVYSRPPRIIITLHVYSPLGIELYFLPPATLFPCFNEHPQITDLLETFKSYKSSFTN